MKILIAGCGQLGQELGEILQKDGHIVTGIKRNPTPTLFPIVNIDLNSQAELFNLPLDNDVIIFNATPSGRDEESYKQVYTDTLSNVISLANTHKTKPLFIFLSSTGVYGQNSGEWVDETSPTNPSSFSGNWVLYGENKVLNTLEKPLIIRFSGIYNSQRRWLINKALKNEPMKSTPKAWTNRIHQSDCVGILRFIIDKYKSNTPLQKCYLASDDKPVVLSEVMSFISNQLSLNDIDIIGDSEKINKRCSNRKIKKLGYDFLYPSYESGYKKIITNL